MNGDQQYSAHPQSRTWFGAAGIGIVIGIAALLVSIVSAYYGRKQADEAEKAVDVARQANEIARQASERATGRISAKMQYLGATNPDQAAPTLVSFLGEKKDIRAIRFSTVDDLMLYDPRIYLRNTGDEPIDAIRIEVFISGDVVVRLSLPPNIQHGQALIRQSEIQDFQLTQKMLPKHELGIPLAKALLGQMMQARGEPQQVCHSVFAVRISAKMVGGHTFDPLDRDVRVYIPFAWVVGGFQQDKCRKVYDEMQLRVEPPPPSFDKLDSGWPRRDAGSGKAP